MESETAQGGCISPLCHFKGTLRKLLWQPALSSTPSQAPANNPSYQHTPPPPPSLRYTLLRQETSSAVKCSVRVLSKEPWSRLCIFPHGRSWMRRPTLLCKLGVFWRFWLKTEGKKAVTHQPYTWITCSFWPGNQWKQPDVPVVRSLFKPGIPNTQNTS